jgi:hypothetical protein
MEGFENLIKYNDDNSVNVPFGRVAEWYIINHPLLKNIRLKCQMRRETAGLIKAGIINVSRVLILLNGTQKGDTKSTNRIDDIIKLTFKGSDCFSLCGMCVPHNCAQKIFIYLYINVRNYTYIIYKIAKILFALRTVIFL